MSLNALKLKVNGFKYEYDDHNRLIHFEGYNESAFCKHDISIEYDDKGRIIKSKYTDDVSAPTTITYEYDENDRLILAIELKHHLTNAIDTTVTHYRYDNECVTKTVQTRNYSKVFITDSKENVVYSEVTYFGDELHKHNTTRIIERDIDYNDEIMIESEKYISDGKIEEIRKAKYSIANNEITLIGSLM